MVASVPAGARLLLCHRAAARSDRTAGTDHQSGRYDADHNHSSHCTDPNAADSPLAGSPVTVAVDSPPQLILSAKILSRVFAVGFVPREA